jgi:molybdopterin/thiamine biosynthesis adenylyltransferase
MSITAKQENARTLARLAGVSEEAAAEKLLFRVRIHSSEGFSDEFARYLTSIVGLTLEVSSTEQTPDLEVFINRPSQGGVVPSIAIVVDSKTMTISQSELDYRLSECAPPPLALKIAACYAAGVIISLAVGDSRCDVLQSTFTLAFSNLGIVPEWFSESLVIRDSVLAGGGGVANGFLWALQGLDVSGELTIADPKKISLGNMNRCICLSEADIGKNKSEALCTNVKMPRLQLIPFVGTYEELRKARGKIRRVLVTVDSRPARRAIQHELPAEVLDASTTDITAVVVHSHFQPTKGACLSCIYKHIPREDEQARNIAGGLGITPEEAKQELIDKPLATKLAAIHPDLDRKALIGSSLTTLYKELCAAQALKTPAGEQALAPFAFISILAGTLLVLELFRAGHRNEEIANTNFLQVDPWRAPHSRVRRFRGRDTDCHFCSDASNLSVLRDIWGAE